MFPAFWTGPRSANHGGPRGVTYLIRTAFGDL